MVWLPPPPEDAASSSVSVEEPAPESTNTPAIARWCCQVGVVGKTPVRFAQYHSDKFSRGVLDHCVLWHGFSSGFPQPSADHWFLAARNTLSNICLFRNLIYASIVTNSCYRLKKPGHSPLSWNINLKLSLTWLLTVARICNVYYIKKVDQNGMDWLLYKANLDGLPVFQELFEHVRLKC